MKTTDPLMVSYVMDLLAQHKILAFEFDGNVSFVEGSIGIFPRRVMVVDEDLEEARAILREAGLTNELQA